MVFIRGGDSHIYSAMYEDQEVFIKAVPYEETTYNRILAYKDFLNFINEAVQVAYYIAPSVETDDEMTMTVTMSAFAKGVDPK